MVIIKNKISNSKEVMFIGTYMKMVSDFDNRRFIILFDPGIKMYISFRIFDELYPNNRLKYYESYVISTLMEFMRDFKRNMKVNIMSHVKGDIATLQLDVKDYSSTRREIPVEVIFDVEIHPIHLGKVFVSYDDLRDAIVVKIKDDNHSKEILIGIPNKEIKTFWEYERNICITNKKTIKRHIATMKCFLNKDYSVLDVYISDDVDKYDNAFLEFNSINEYKEVMNTNINTLCRTYNYFYNYLKNSIFSNTYYSIIRDYYLYNKLNKEGKGLYKTSLKGIWDLFAKDIARKKVDWLSVADENILGRSLLHTLLLANKLVDEGHYRQAYSLVKNFSDSFYDILNFSLVDKLSNESRIIEMMFLYMRVINKLFLNVYIKGSVLWHSFYLPKALSDFEIRNLVHDNLLLDFVNIIRYPQKIKYSLGIAPSGRNISNVRLKIITDEAIKDKALRLRGNKIKETQDWILL